MDLPQIIFVANLLSTWFMVGLIWMVQIVHYPLFKEVGSENYVRYQHQHQSRITWIVAPVMFVEITTGFLMAYYRVDVFSKWAIYCGIVALLVIWLSTAMLQVPGHSKLAKGFEANVHQRLVQGNWLRTVAWTLRGFLVGYLLHELIALSSTTATVP